MLAVSRSVLCLLAVSSWSLAAADPGPPAPTAPKVVAAAPAGVKTIVIVRHAEAEATQPGGDPPLTADGRSRAAELARVLGDTPMRSVYSTHYQRTRLTGEGLVRSGDKPIVIDDVPGTLKALRAEPWGATALVVGHSNTVPELIRGLTGHALPDTEPIVFDRIWIVTLARDGAPSLLRLHYGAPVALSK
jgi:broad specificity phosphatase PhoE